MGRIATPVSIASRRPGFASAQSACSGAGEAPGIGGTPVDVEDRGSFGAATQNVTDRAAAAHSSGQENL